MDSIEVQELKKEIIEIKEQNTQILLIVNELKKSINELKQKNRKYSNITEYNSDNE